jgi:DNA polymerase III epsilon subunit-like protein
MTELENQNVSGKSTIYASVDLELSGFDPETDEIIEVGISRFVIENGTFVVIDSFGSLVRPKL